MNKSPLPVHSPGILLALGIALLVAVPGIADDREARERELRAVQQKIEKLTRAIEVKEDSKSRYIKQLKSIERNIGTVNRKIRAMSRRIADKQAELKTLRADRLAAQRRLSRESDMLAEQIYVAFTLGREEKVRLLFSQQDPARLQRNLVYYQYFSNARAELIGEVQRNIDRILETEALIRKARKDLEKSQLALRSQETSLKKDLGKRKNIIATLDTQLKQQGGDLARLRDEAEQLQQLIESIQQILDDAPEGEITREAFADLRGKLAWPVDGKVRRLYGRRKPRSDLRWQGIVIEARSGSEVRAVSHGRVAFADWLRGFGNLIIVDHGDAYLSLYGHNESLFKSAGDWVEAGEVISSVGSSGGQSRPALYFEIRKRGKPQNPTAWCSAANRFAAG